MPLVLHEVALVVNLIELTLTHGVFEGRAAHGRPYPRVPDFASLGR